MLLNVKFGKVLMSDLYYCKNRKDEFLFHSDDDTNYTHVPSIKNKKKTR